LIQGVFITRGIMLGPGGPTWKHDSQKNSMKKPRHSETPFGQNTDSFDIPLLETIRKNLRI